MRRLYAFIMMVISMSSLSLAGVPDDNWEFFKEAGEVRIYSREMEGSDFKAYKTTMDVNIPFETAVEIAKDHNHYRDWYGMCKDIFLIAKRSGHDYDMYCVLDMPGGASDRDLVINIRTEWDYTKGRCQVAIKRKESAYKSDSGGAFLKQ